ncbi:Rpn family recombination-promoting nuclease/putative transposase [Chitinimonas arctica]|uniref:Rpn family recombination-promoting nuclease/putative transposase n=1 Tax=Chitinimonas arctica TaxID=2594795 RepID=A0A516S9Q8_9NEIS|nr:Rpn family recombination-promoting nuclease/putative transposase [Chitinimonas arctica]QDQ24884.1 Rpn family recombination-promoting nuclease/putative transposase [Chitinimonas arctica]
MEMISPRVDIAFKKLFGVEENKDLLISLVNAIVGEADQITDVTLLNPYNRSNFWRDKISILDLKAKGSNGQLLNIEIQVNDVADYDKRALYYWAKLYTDQLGEGAGYDKLAKAIGIHILNFNSIPGMEGYHNIFRIQKDSGKLHYFQDLELHTIELKKFTSDAEEGIADIVAKVREPLDRWVAFLTRHDLMNKDCLPSSLDDPEIKRALNVLEYMSFGKDEREAYEGRLKWLRTEASALKKHGTEKFEEGKVEGKLEGKLEGKIEVAKALLKEHMAMQAIVNVTGLPLQQIEALGLGR